MLLMLCAAIDQAMAASNQLRGHPVPYLALHGDDPIHWQEWGPEVMERARREDKVVLLSIGYYSCHWCHVMQRESFQNSDIAEFVNEHFIFVKVDKEMNPLLDDAMMSFAQATIRRGGWPLNVFIAPTGSPIYALIYLPPEQFRLVLERMKTIWETDRDALLALVERLTWDAEAEAIRAPRDGEIETLQLSARQRIMRRADQFQGGFGSQSKFPSVPQLRFLLEAAERYPDEESAEFLTTTLNAMVELGLRDHLAGGFFRYTVDPGWEIPHFEKMLYDNVSLAQLFLDAGRVFERQDYLEVAQETLRFMRDRMWGDSALMSSLSAVDDKDIEGGYYLWQTDELRELLTAQEYAAADAAWGVARPPDLEAGNHIRQLRGMEEAAKKLGQPLAETKALLRTAGEKLLTARDLRGLPVDYKQVSGWNGLALAVFTDAAEIFPDDGFAETAAKLQHFLVEEALKNEGSEKLSLARAIVDGEPHGVGSLEDYAYVALGLARWAQSTGMADDITRAAAVARAGWSRYFEGNGWRRSPGLVRTIPEVVPVFTDGATLSPSTVLVDISGWLAAQLDDEAWASQVQKARFGGLDRLAEEPYWYVGQLVLLMRDGDLERQ